MRKTRIMVLMGGKSPEYEVSLASGREIIRNLDKRKYHISFLTISRKGKGLEKLLKTKADIVFIAMHGPFGEDGKIQGMLEALGLKYTGSGVLASAIGMDKPLFRKIMQEERLPNPRYINIKQGDKIPTLKRVLGKFPYVVKPSAQGSSVGVCIVKNNRHLKKAIKNSLRFGDGAIVEGYLDGIEVTCPVMGNMDPFALPVIEIIPKNKFFDYESKYSTGGAQEIVPARISNKLTREVQELAVKAYKVVGCRGFARVDFILKDKKTPIILEINTIPGLTPTSLFPKSTKVAGMSYSKMLDKIIGYGLE